MSEIDRRKMEINGQWICPREPNYLLEARDILAGRSSLLPERRHLEALHEAHQSELIRIAHEIQQMMDAMLRRN